MCSFMWMVAVAITLPGDYAHVYIMGVHRSIHKHDKLCYSNNSTQRTTGDIISDGDENETGPSQKKKRK